MNNSECIEVFKQYLANEKKASANTLSSYLRDIRQLGEYLEIHHDTEIMDAKEEELAERAARSDPYVRLARQSLTRCRYPSSIAGYTFRIHLTFSFSHPAKSPRFARRISPGEPK